VAAGRARARAPARFADRDDVAVLGLPRGGVVVAAEVARALGAPLDVLLVRKLGAPGLEELAIGAIADGPEPVIETNPVALAHLAVSEAALGAIARRELTELGRRGRLYRAGREPLDVAGRVAIVVDDGLAPGSTLRAAVAAVRRRRPARIVVAAPVASHAARKLLSPVADECVFAAEPEPFLSVGTWYQDFAQTEDAEVLERLARFAPPAVRTGARRERAAEPPP
jgi:predicted phosphoribosyltransferase